MQDKTFIESIIFTNDIDYDKQMNCSNNRCIDKNHVLL
jgi:hypothetical protein